MFPIRTILVSLLAASACFGQVSSYPAVSGNSVGATISGAVSCPGGVCTMRDSVSVMDPAYAVVKDGQTNATCSITSGTAALSCTNSVFVVADATSHKAIKVLGAGSTSRVTGGTISVNGTSGCAYGTVAVSFSGGGGSGAAANLVFSAGVGLNFVLLNPGTGYTSAPTWTTAQGTCAAQPSGTTALTKEALVTTISSYQSATAVTLAANAGTTVGPTATIVWGTDTTAALNAAIVNAKARGFGTLQIPSGNYFISGNGLGLDHIGASSFELVGDGEGTANLYITGAIGLDMGGSEKITVRDLGIVGFDAGVGLLLCRYLDSSYNGQSHFQRVWMRGSYTTADVYSISDEDNTYDHVFFENSIAGKVYYTNQTNDLNVATPRGTQAGTPQSNIHTTITGSMFRNCVSDPSTVALHLDGVVDGFDFKESYLITNGKGLWRSGVNGTEYSGELNFVGAYIENCIQAPHSYPNYYPVYFDPAKFDHMTFNGGKFIQSDGAANPDVYQVPAGVGGYVRASRFNNNYGPNGYTFWNLQDTDIWTNYNVTTVNDAFGNRIRAAANTFSGTEEGNEVMTDTTATQTFNQSFTRGLTSGTTSISPTAGVTSVGSSFNGGLGVGSAVVPTLNKEQITCSAISHPMTAGTVTGCLGMGGAGTYGLYMGTLGSGDSWIEALRADSVTYYNLELETNGGNVLIGTETNSASGARLQVAGGISTSTFLTNTVGSLLTQSSNVITPTSAIHHVAAGLIKTITAPTAFAQTGLGGCITLIPDAAFTTDATGNIAIASTAVTSKAMQMCYDNATTKWYPSY